MPLADCAPALGIPYQEMAVIPVNLTPIEIPKHQAPAGWSDEDKTQLQTLWDKGLTAAEISRQNGRTRNSVIGQAHRMGLRGRPSPIRRAKSKADLGGKTPYGKIEMMDLRNNSCRYPTANPGGKNHHLYCGRTTYQVKPYCEEHSRLCFAGLPPPKKSTATVEAKHIKPNEL